MEKLGTNFMVLFWPCHGFLFLQLPAGFKFCCRVFFLLFAWLIRWSRSVTSYPHAVFRDRGIGGKCHFLKLIWWQSHHFNNLSLKGTKVSDFQKCPYFTHSLLSYLDVFRDFFLTDLQWRLNTITLSIHLHWIINFVALRRRIRGSSSPLSSRWSSCPVSSWGCGGNAPEEFFGSEVMYEKARRRN